MKKVFIGHRGVGKTHLLKRHKSYFPEIRHFDLDDEIEKGLNTSVVEYFQRCGEADFRKIEIEIFQKLINENTDYVISLGAGFDVSKLPADIEALYVVRSTDKDGRIFLNRPRLETGVGPLEEYKKRFNARVEGYSEAAYKIYHMPEGVDSENDIEKTILNEKFEINDAFYTLSDQELHRIDSLIKCYKNIELRTDLLGSGTIQGLLNRFPEHNWLVSIRSPGQFNFTNANNIDADYQYYSEGCQILSSHADSIVDGIKQLHAVSDKLHLKLCPLVGSFDDLMKGHDWQRQDRKNRSFLPRSKDGRWIWYRQLSRYWQKVNFIRNFTEMADQPSLYEWLILPTEKPCGWGAVLGQPIHFSRSCVQHQNYLSERNSFFTKIEISSEEFKSHIKFLTDLGLKYVAVTSPLKEMAFKISDIQTEVAKQFKTANTLYSEQQQIISHNTDLPGFEELVKNIKRTDKVAIWGGGGTLAMMKSVLPEAHCYSSQTGRLREADAPFRQSYDYLVWAAPRTELTQWPQDNLEVATLIDLNYTDNSMGLEFAAHRKIGYISGAEMFKLQALKQQEFWSSNERK